MPVYKKSPGKWRVRVWNQGIRQDWIVEGSKAEAEAFEARKRLEAPGEIRIVPTLADFSAGHYVLHAQAHLKKSTLRNRLYQLETLLEHLGSLKLDRITPAEIETFKASRTRDGIRPATVNDDLKVLSVVLNHARSLGVAIQAPAFKILPVRGKRRNAEPWSRADVAELLKVCADLDPELLPVVVFLLNTGCRKGEALSLERRNVDLAAGIVRIWASEEWQPKSGKNREVPINAALRPWLEGSGRWVFPTRKGTRFVGWPQNRFDRVRQAALLEGGPHKCRHTYASHFLAARHDLNLLGRIMGHSHAKVTALYGHLLPDAIKDAAEVVSFGYGVGTDLPAR